MKGPLAQIPKEAFYQGKVPLLSKVLLDGITPLEIIFKRAQEEGLGAIAITDHNTIVGSLLAQKFSEKFGITLISAMEVSTLQGEILAYGVKRKIPMHLSAAETLELIHRQGGVAVAAHPFHRFHPNPDFRALPLRCIEELPLDGMEIVGLLYQKDKCHCLARKLNLAHVGGSDAHTPAGIGAVWTEFPASCKRLPDFLDAIRQKQTTVGMKRNRGRILLASAWEYMWSTSLGRLKKQSSPEV